MATRPRSPISPHPEDSGRQPRIQRTPVFPNLQISKSRVHRRRRGILALLLVLLLTAGAGVGSWWWMAGRFTVVPAVSGSAEAAALASAEANDLRTERVLEYSEEVAAGIVISTDPGAGERMLRGAVVTVVVSRGPERFNMPEVVGQSQAEAERMLAEQNLVVGQVTEAWSETVGAGEVMSASQEAGQPLKRDTAIDMVVSKGREPLTVVDHTGKDANTAQRALEDAGFEVTRTTEHSAHTAAGLVILQTPSSGQLHRGDTVELVVSLGPVMVEIPDVRYKSTDDAKQLLEDLGLEVTIRYVTDFPLPLERASGTDPARGTSVPEGSTVTLLVA